MPRTDIPARDDGLLGAKLSPPGSSGGGTNPEQLFAAGWSACFIAAMQRVARALEVAFPAGAAVDAEVDLAVAGDAFVLQARLNVRLPGLRPEVAWAVAEGAHELCPYSKAARGDIDVAIDLI